MPLNKSALKNDFEKIFDIEKSPEVESIEHCALLITDAIVKYLGDAKIAGLKAPGINPVGAAGGPLPDPGFASVAGQPMSPVTPPNAMQIALTAAWVSTMVANSIEGDKLWEAADAAMMAYVVATYTAFSSGGYMATGVTAPGPINLGSVFSPEYEDASEMSEKLADHIHDFFTASTFTGAYMMGPFIGPGPHVAALE